MAGRSIDDILRQQAAQRQAQIQQQQSQERALNEQRERQRQEHLQRMRMFEKLSNINPSAAAASSAGGKSNSITTINGHVEFILFTTSDSDNHQYVILDYLAETISDIKDTGINKLEDFNLSMIENTGWVIEFDTQILFINDNAEIVKSLDKTDFFTSRYRRNYYYAIFNDGTLYQFDGKVINTYTINLGTNDTDIQVSKNSLVFASLDLNNTVNVYVWNPTIGSVNVWSGSGANGDTNRYNALATSNETSFFAVATFNDVTDGWKTINIFGDDGTTKSSLDITTSANNLNSGYLNVFGDNKLDFFNYRGVAGGSYYFNIYDYNTDTWRTTSHAKTNYSNNQFLIQSIYDGSQYTSLSNGVAHIIYGSASTSSAYNIDLYSYVDVVWSINGSTPSTYTVNNSGTNNKGIDINDANRDGYSNNSLYLGKSMFFPMWLNDSKISLLCLTSTQSVVISAATTTNLTGSQGYTLIPGWNDGQKYASFRVGDNFGIWLAYASNDVYKIYNEFGANVISLTMSVNTRLNYTGDVAVVTDDNAGIEYVFTSNSIVLGLSPSYATYSTLGGINYYGLKPTYTDGDTTPSLMLNLNEGGLSRIFTDEDVYEFTVPELTWNRWLSDEYIVLEGRDGTNYILYFYDWSGTLLSSVDTGVVSGTSYVAELVKDRIYFKVVDGTTTTYYYFSPTKSDSVSIENETTSDVNYDYWSWWAN